MEVAMTSGKVVRENTTNNYKLFVWDEVLGDWTEGLIFAFAEDLESARSLIIEKYSTPDSAIDINRIKHEIEKTPRIIDKPYTKAITGCSG